MSRKEEKTYGMKKSVIRVLHDTEKEKMPEQNVAHNKNVHRYHSVTELETEAVKDKDVTKVFHGEDEFDENIYEVQERLKSIEK